MKQHRWFKRISSYVGIAITVTFGSVACNGASPSPTPSPTVDSLYQLTHTSADAEYILGWDQITKACPTLSEYQKIEGFVRREESIRLKPGDSPMTLAADAPVAWGNIRGVTDAPEGAIAEGDARPIGWPKLTRSALSRHRLPSNPSRTSLFQQPVRASAG